MAIKQGLRILAASLAAAFAVFYQFSLKHTLSVTGIFPKHTYTSIGSKKCKEIQVEACEKIVLHEPTGHIYMACSWPHKRRQWMPTLDLLDPAGAGSDYIAHYNPENGKVIRMKMAGMIFPWRFSTHGMDVVTASNDSALLYFYTINHQAPENGDPKVVGADSVIDIWSGRPTVEAKGSSRITLVKTFRHAVIDTPNDLTGSPDGKSFYFTNDHGSRTEKSRAYEVPLRLSKSSVGYCHVDDGCKLAATGLKSSNGIVNAGNGTIYVGSLLGHIQAMEQQTDNTLTVGDYIQLDRMIDNLSLDINGALYAAGFKNARDVLKHWQDPKHPAGSSGLRITRNTGHDSFFGQKYRVDTVFEDNGKKMPPATSVVVDVKRKRMFLHGLISPHMLECEL